MQQGGGGAPQSSDGYHRAAAEAVISTDEHQKLGDLGIAEAASPISSRPPAAIGSTNFEELMRSTAEAGGGGGSGNRWPRQETLALLQIRSEMDAVFRDATLKGPLWEQVSRKLGELGYKRSAKKCKEKFENVHKYYKRTKEGRGGRQDGKSYKFFDQLEALHHPSTSTPDNNLVQTTTLPRISHPTSSSAAPLPPPGASAPPPPLQSSPLPPFASVGISFSSSESSSSSDDEEMETGHHQDRKRKRSGGDGSRSSGSDERMMDFFEGLLKQVMQKQEAMQNKFLEAIEKREHDRMIREEAWKRQDMARLAKEHDLMAQERAICASRDAAIVAFLEKITGQTIHLPTTVAPQNPPPPPPPSAEPQVPHQRQFVFNVSSQPPSTEMVEVHQPNTNSDQNQNQNQNQNQIVAAIPEQQIPLQEYTGGLENMASSSRWPKAEVLALIQIRSGLEPKYQENGPKGPLWEEISAAMQRIGYNRSAKRCKEKWENINKYFKKVKESNKKRPQDAKTCPYFHELDELYRKKILTGNVISGGTSGGSAEQERQQQQQQDVATGSLQASSTAGAFQPTVLVEQSQHNSDVAKQPEGMLKKHNQQGHGDHTMVIEHDHDLDMDENYNDSYEEVDENEEYDDKTEEEMKMVYKIQYQGPNVGGGSSNGGGNTTSTSFMAMVQ